MAVREGQTLIIPIATAAAPDPEPGPTAPGAGSPTPELPSAKKPLPDEKTEATGTKPKDTPASPDLGADKTTSVEDVDAGRRQYDPAPMTRRRTRASLILLLRLAVR